MVKKCCPSLYTVTTEVLQTAQLSVSSLILLNNNRQEFEFCVNNMTVYLHYRGTAGSLSYWDYPSTQIHMSYVQWGSFDQIWIEVVQFGNAICSLFGANVLLYCAVGRVRALTCWNKFMEDYDKVDSLECPGSFKISSHSVDIGFTNTWVVQLVLVEKHWEVTSAEECAIQMNICIKPYYIPSKIELVDRQTFHFQMSLKLLEVMDGICFSWPIS